MPRTETRNRRVPGSPVAKLEIIKKLSPKLFPHLVGDILYYLNHHWDVKIMDGPGDGKRDIHSRLAQSDLFHITQCKYSKDPKKTLSSSDADELIIALNKFGGKNGTLATTVQISPQLKREYISDYPGYTLNFMEGIDVVNAVYSSPLLTRAWTTENGLVKNYQTIIIPIAMRELDTDQNVPTDHVRWSRWKPTDFNRLTDFARIENFSPFRTPSSVSFNDHGDKFYTSLFVCKKISFLHELPSAIERLFKQISKCFSDPYANLAIRIGRPLIANLKHQDILESITLTATNPETRILLGKELLPEKSWLLPEESPDWVFPKRFGHLEASRAGWFNKKNDCILSLALAQPYNDRDDPFHAMSKEIMLTKINESLFVGVTKKQKNTIRSRLKENELWNWECPFGIKDSLIGWVHPYTLKEGMVNHYMENKKIVYNEGEEDKQFYNLTKYVSSILNQLKYKIITPKHAIHYAVGADMPLYKEYEITTFDSAFLYHFYADLRSPVFTNRQLTFIKMWTWNRGAFKAKKFATRISEISIDKAIKLAIQLIKDRSNNNFIKVEIVTNVPVEKPTCYYVEDYFPIIVEVFNKIDNLILGEDQGAKSTTETYWWNEIGIRF